MTRGKVVCNLVLLTVGGDGPSRHQAVHGLKLTRDHFNFELAVDIGFEVVEGSLPNSIAAFALGLDFSYFFVPLFCLYEQVLLAVGAAAKSSVLAVIG